MAWRKYPYTPQVNRRGPMSFTYRPLVEIAVSGENNTETFMALVDSGTEITMMDSEIAAVLGIDPIKGKKATASGIGGDKPGFLCKVHIQVQGFDDVLTCNVLFIENLTFDIILGQDDFFKRFLVKFEKRKNTFYLDTAL